VEMFPSPEGTSKMIGGVCIVGSSAALLLDWSVHLSLVAMTRKTKRLWARAILNHQKKKTVEA